MREVNDRLMKVERMFLEPGGLPGRPLERHVLQAPSKIDSYGSSSWAGIIDSATYADAARRAGQAEQEKYWLTQLKVHFTKVAQMVDRAARFLTDPSKSLVQTIV